MKPKSIKRTNVDVLSLKAWQSLRQPFILPKGYCSVKPHDWEPIAVDMAGCKKCGEIHICNEQEPTNCKQESIENVTVCCITGFVLRTNNFQGSWTVSGKPEVIQEYCSLRTGNSVNLVAVRRKK